MEQVSSIEISAPILFESFQNWIAKADPGDSITFQGVALFEYLGDDFTLSVSPKAYVHALLGIDGNVQFGVEYIKGTVLIPTNHTVIQGMVVRPNHIYSDYGARFDLNFLSTEVTINKLSTVLEFATELSLEPRVVGESIAESTV